MIIKARKDESGRFIPRNPKEYMITDSDISEPWVRYNEPETDKNIFELANEWLDSKENNKDDDE